MYSDSAAAVAVRRIGGVARTSALRNAGLTNFQLAAAVRCGELIRPRVGVYALPETSAAVVEALSHRGAIACVTAARELGLWVLDDGDDEPVHTWIASAHHPTRMALVPFPEEGGCCVIHRCRPLDAPLLDRVGILHCLVQILGCRGEEAFFAALESALRQRRVSARQRRRLRAAVPSQMRWLVDFARSDADSGLESLVRLRLHRHGLTLASQVKIPGVGRVDFVIGDCLILEADGGTHGGDSRHSDRVRDAAAAALGFSTLRFDSALILHEWALVEAAILATVSRGVHQSHAGTTWADDAPI